MSSSSRKFIAAYMFFAAHIMLLGIMPPDTCAAEGDFVWAKQLNNSYRGENLSISTDSTGNILAAGSFYGTVDFDPGPNTYNITAKGDDIFILKLKGNGDFQWSKSIGGGSFDYNYSLSIDGEDNILLTGFFQNSVDFDPGNETYSLTAISVSDIFILKLDSDGNFIWAKSFGGMGSDHGYSITTDEDGNVYSTGIFWDTVDFDPNLGITNLTSIGFQDFYISKIDKNGEFLWAKSIGGSGSDYAKSIALDFNGFIYATGSFLNTVDFDPGTGIYELDNVGSSDIFILKLGIDGDFIWAKSMGGTGIDRGNVMAPKNWTVR